MTEDQRSACADLAEACELRSEEEVARYIEAVDRLRTMPSREVLRQLLWCLRDREAGEAQYELVEACEAYPRDTYVRVFLEEGPIVFAKAPSWFGLMFQSILNSEAYRESALRELARLPPEIRGFFTKALQQISASTPKYEALLRDLE